MLERERTYKVIVTVLVVMLMASLVLTVMSFAIPTPALASQTLRVEPNACGSCGVEKDIYTVYEFQCWTCCAGCCWCRIGQWCDYC